MQSFGLKKLLILSVLILVGTSVSISSYVVFLGEKEALTDSIYSENSSFVAAQANEIEVLINEKVNGVNKLAERFQESGIQGTAEEIIAKTQIYSSAMNLGSMVIAYENGDAFWSYKNSAWPEHKLATDVTKKGWYQSIRNASSVTVTDPYLGSAGDEYWLTIGEKIKGGIITADMTLAFLNEMTKHATDRAGVVAMILNHDETVLASSSPVIELGKKATDYPWFAALANKAVNSESTIQDYTLDGEDKLLFSQQINVGDKKWYFTIGLNRSIAFAKLEESRNAAIFTSIIAVIASMLIAFFIIQRLYRPILELKETIVDLSSGDADLTRRLVVTSSDELGQIAQGVNRFIENLQVMMREVQSATATLQSRVGEMHHQSERNDNILQSHVSETEQIVTAIEEMSATADAMATDASNTAKLTNQASESGNKSRRIALQSQDIVSGLILDVDSAVENVGEMSAKTEGINSILEVISGIAEQTNLLALNAAIEAARAGEQGRGFAVVADEVRNLASRTKDSTEEVEAALESLIQGTQVVVKSMDHTKVRCKDTANSSEEMAEGLDAMSNYVSDINGLSTQIATAAEEQSSVTQELARNMATISEMVQELQANGQQALQGTEDITSVNNQLSAIVNRFKL